MVIFAVVVVAPVPLVKVKVELPEVLAIDCNVSAAPVVAPDHVTSPIWLEEVTDEFEITKA